MKTIIITAFVTLSCLGSPNLSAYEKCAITIADKQPNKPVITKVLLAKHETVAVYMGTKFHRCNGLTALCPEQCGDSGEYARFKILDYTLHKKLEKYGSAKQKEFRVRISDFNKNVVGSPHIHKLLTKLKKGDHVVLHWNHNYVTTKSGEFTSQSPEHLIVKLARKEDQ